MWCLLLSSTLNVIGGCDGGGPLLVVFFTCSNRNIAAM